MSLAINTILSAAARLKSCLGVKTVTCSEKALVNVLVRVANTTSPVHRGPEVVGAVMSALVVEKPFAADDRPPEVVNVAAALLAASAFDFPRDDRCDGCTCEDECGQTPGNICLRAFEESRVRRIGTSFDLKEWGAADPNDFLGWGVILAEHVEKHIGWARSAYAG